MLETLPRWQRGAIAEDRAFQKYGGIRHPNLHSTIPDLLRVHKGEFEFIEVKYINLDYFCNLQSRLCQIKSQLTKRKKFLPKGATQRLYVLFDNPEILGWVTEELSERVWQAVKDVVDTVEIEVLFRQEEAAADNA